MCVCVGGAVDFENCENISLIYFVQMFQLFFCLALKQALECLLVDTPGSAASFSIQRNIQYGEGEKNMT